MIFPLACEYWLVFTYFNRISHRSDIKPAVFLILTQVFHQPGISAAVLTWLLPLHSSSSSAPCILRYQVFLCMQHAVPFCLISWALPLSSAVLQCSDLCFCSSHMCAYRSHSFLHLRYWLHLKPFSISSLLTSSYSSSWRCSLPVLHKERIVASLPVFSAARMVQ